MSAASSISIVLTAVISGAVFGFCYRVVGPFIARINIPTPVAFMLGLLVGAAATGIAIGLALLLTHGV